MRLRLSCPNHEQKTTAFPLDGRHLLEVENCKIASFFYGFPLPSKLCLLSLTQLVSNRLDGTDMGSWLSFFHLPNDRRICRIYGHHQKNVLILLQCIAIIIIFIAMWEERKIHIVPISLWLSVLYTKFHPSKKKTYFCPRRWQWPLVRHQLAFAFTSESSPFLSSCWLSFIQIYVSKMKDDTLMLCKCW